LALTAIDSAPATGFHSAVAYAPLLRFNILRESDATPDPDNPTSNKAVSGKNSRVALEGSGAAKVMKTGVTPSDSYRWKSSCEENVLFLINDN